MKRKPRWSCELSASAQKIRKTTDVQAPTLTPAAGLTKPIGALFLFFRLLFKRRANGVAALQI